jgi:hypothetical protein
MTTIRFSSEEFTVDATIGELPAGFSTLIERARVHDDHGIKESGGTQLIIQVQSTSADWPELVISQRFSPGAEAGFHPGILLVPETKVLFVGAGVRLLAYDLSHFALLWEDAADTGFWGWRRHRDVIIMSAELELAAWDLAGKKLWSSFVEPPWNYNVEGMALKLDVMGRKSQFGLKSGPLALVVDNGQAFDRHGGP